MLDNERRRPSFLREQVVAFLCGIGIGIGAMSYCYEQKHLMKFFTKNDEVVQEESILTKYGRLNLSKKQYDMLERGLAEVARKTGWHNAGVWNNWCDILARQGTPVMDANIRKVIDDTLNPFTPMGRLASKYRGPKVAPRPSENDERQLEELISQYEMYQQAIEALMDENYDQDITREERNRAIYKLFHQ